MYRARNRGSPPLVLLAAAACALLTAASGAGCKTTLDGIAEELTPFTSSDGPDALEDLADWIKENPEHADMARARYMQAIGHFDWLLLSLDREDAEELQELATSTGKRSACAGDAEVEKECTAALLAEVHEMFARIRLKDLETSARDNADLGAELTRPDDVLERSPRYFRVVAAAAADNTDMAVRARAMKLIHARELLRGLAEEKDVDLSRRFSEEWAYPCPAHFAELPDLRGDELDEALEHCELDDWDDWGDEDEDDADSDEDDGTERRSRGRRASKAVIEHSHAAAEERVASAGEIKAAEMAVLEAKAEAEARAREAIAAGAPAPIRMDPAATIRIDSDPLGAEVYVDGMIKGLTPLEVLVDMGERTIELRKAGYDNWTSTVTLTAGEFRVISTTLAGAAIDATDDEIAPLYRKPVRPPPDEPPPDTPDEPPAEGGPPVAEIIIEAALGDIVATIADAEKEKVKFLDDLPGQVQEALAALRFPAPFDIAALGITRVDSIPASAASAPAVLVSLGPEGASILLRPVLVVGEDGSLAPASGAAEEFAPPGKRVGATDAAAAIRAAGAATGAAPDAAVGLSMRKGLAWTDAAAVLRSLADSGISIQLVATRDGTELRGVAAIRFVSADTIAPAAGPDVVATTVAVTVSGGVATLVRWGGPKYGGITLPMIAHGIPNTKELGFTLEGAASLWGGSATAINKIVVVPADGADGATVTSLVVEASALPGSPEVVLADRLLESKWPGPESGPTESGSLGVGKPKAAGILGVLGARGDGPGRGIGGIIGPSSALDGAEGSKPSGLGGAIMADDEKATKKPTVKSGSAKVAGSLSAEVIRRVIRRHTAKLKYCYEKALVKDPALAGKIVVKFTIGASGSVTSASIESDTLGDPSVGECIVPKVEKMLFPKPEGGGEVVVSYPFVFKT